MIYLIFTLSSKYTKEDLVCRSKLIRNCTKISLSLEISAKGILEGIENFFSKWEASSDLEGVYMVGYEDRNYKAILEVTKKLF